MDFSDLPDELLGHIFQQLKKVSLATLIGTCPIVSQRWKRISAEPSLWNELDLSDPVQSKSINDQKLRSILINLKTKRTIHMNKIDIGKCRNVSTGSMTLLNKLVMEGAFPSLRTVILIGCNIPPLAILHLHNNCTSGISFLHDTTTPLLPSNGTIFALEQRTNQLLSKCEENISSASSFRKAGDKTNCLLALKERRFHQLQIEKIKGIISMKKKEEERSPPRIRKRQLPISANKLIFGE